MMVMSVDLFKIHGFAISRNKFTGFVWHVWHIPGFYYPIPSNPFPSVRPNTREEFDEEKEPDGMVLTGWTPAPIDKDTRAIGNGESTSDAPQKALEAQDDSDEIEMVTQPGAALAGSKRRLLEISNADGEVVSACNQKPEEEDDVVLMLDGNVDIGKKKRLQ